MSMDSLGDGARICMSDPRLSKLNPSAWTRSCIYDADARAIVLLCICR